MSTISARDAFIQVSSGAYDTVKRSVHMVDRDSSAPATAAVRVDRWLWAARVFKSRSLAADACAGGKVDVNDEAAKPARSLRRGDVVKVTVTAGRRRTLRVVELGVRRGSAQVARTLYEDLTPPEPPRPQQPARIARLPGAGRPTKRERRSLDRLRGW